ncbi:MAG: hypothetical protein WAO52_19130 [Prolixibacteraceae bacterium]
MFKLSFTITLIILTVVGFAQSPHGDSFKTNCAECHSSKDWVVTKASMTFDHNTTQFKLTGQHQNVDCKSCHQTLKFQEAKNECISCHTDMHQNTLSTDCAQCHNTKAWIIENTNTLHQRTRFPLQGNHAVADCASCHKSASSFRFEPLGIECIDCHRADYQATTSPNHIQAGYSTNCSECHGVKSTGWKASSFEHSFFPLTEGHSITCLECHKDGSFQKISNECVSCHQQNYNSTSNPNHQQSHFSTTCSECHTTSPGWKPANFRQHDASYFPIYSGSHKGEWERCTDCHTTANTYSNFSCVGCHEHRQSEMDDEHRGTNGYSYQSVSCYTCHPQGNKSGAFNHNATAFPLTGAHSKTDCTSCHANGFAGTSTECSACHQANFNNAQTPNHTKAGIPVDCKSCHTSAAWQPSSFNHTTTGFALTGGHAAVVQCSDCHLGTINTAKQECISCHQVQYNNAKGHVASKFPTDCKLCHNSNNWVETTFNHANTNFPLTGAHITTECASCHTAGYVGTSGECSACHQANFNNAQTPNHTKAGIPVDCKTCHTAAAWQPSSFNHTTTGFALTGGHATVVQCSDCHLGSTSNTSSECVSCHQVQYNNAKGHVASKFPTDCKLCHTSANWLQTSFDHSKTSFPLTGSHTTVECASCHAAGYVGTSGECSACHQANFNNAQNPNHTKAGIPVDCKSCHTSTAWQPSSFNHTTTGFALNGGHAAIVQCSDCHLGSTTTTSSECVSCHQVQYNNAKGHVASKFPTDCKLCHNSTNWLQTTFDHSKTSFPLTGAHSSVDCGSCHQTGYAGTPTDCYSCHTTDYNNTTNPAHKAAQFPTDCASCHTVTAWAPSTFNHDTQYFPIYSGKHQGKWNLCSECHTSTTNYTVFSCIICHEHSDKSLVDGEHREVQNYTYTGTSCYSCHPQGRE